MKSGFCPKCGSNEVFIDDGNTEHTHRMGSISFQAYMCLSCGYSENYLTEHDRNRVKRHLEDNQRATRKNKAKNE